VSSPGTTIRSLIAVFEASQTTLGNRLALNLPGITVTVQHMLDALEKVGGQAVRNRVRFERDERIAAIVGNWARGASSDRAHALGLQADASFESIIEQYIEDCRTQPGYPAAALQGL
jgi:nucleoside-diphosphate-sugar epimerase